jgi:ATP-dependent DNA helicase HFM1/MER3
MNALLIQRSLQSQAWDDGPMHMKQIPNIGVAAVRKLVNAGIRTIEELELAEPHRIEMAIGRNPPFGLRTLENVKLFPKLRVSVQALPNTVRIVTHARVLMLIPDQTTRLGDGVKVQFKVEIGFLNEKPVCIFQKHSVYVCLLVETSDGRLAHFARIR